MVSRDMKVKGVPGTWNQINLAIVRVAYTICDQYWRPSLYLSKLDVVLYEITKPRTISMLRATIYIKVVSKVLAIPKSFMVLLMTEMTVDQAPKKMRICQHLNSAVARMAFQNVELNGLPCLKGSGE